MFCLLTYVKFQFAYTTTSEIGSQLLLAFIRPDVLLGRCVECLEVSDVFRYVCPSVKYSAHMTFIFPLWLFFVQSKKVKIDGSSYFVNLVSTDSACGVIKKDDEMLG